MNKLTIGLAFVLACCVGVIFYQQAGYNKLEGNYKEQAKALQSAEAAIVGFKANEQAFKDQLEAKDVALNSYIKRVRVIANERDQARESLELLRRNGSKETVELLNTVIPDELLVRLSVIHEDSVR